MLALVALTLLTAPKLAATGFACEESMKARCEAYMDRFAERLSSKGLKVTTQKDMLQALGLERQRQLLGCSEETGGCLAELGSALGVDGILSGSVTRLAGEFHVTVNVVRARDGTKWAAVVERLDTESDVRALLDATADRFAFELQGGVRSGRGTMTVLAAGFAVVAGVGGVLFGVGKADAGRLRSTVDYSPDGLMSVASRGRTLEPLGLTLLCIGIPVAVAAGLYALLGFSPRESLEQSVGAAGGIAW